MPRNPPTQRREVPTHERSRATVEAILEATARVLVEEGEEDREELADEMATLLTGYLKRPAAREEEGDRP